MEKEDLLNRLDQLEKDKEKLVEELLRLKKKPGRKIAYLLLSLGVILLALAIYFYQNIAAFIGIALTFWGALLLYVGPSDFVRKGILDSVMTESLENYHQLIDELGYKGTPQYISPRTLWGIRNTAIIILKSDNIQMPSSEQLAAKKVLIDNPQAIKLIPPGHKLSRYIEDQIRINFSTMELNSIQDSLQKGIVESLEIAEALHMERMGSTVYIAMEGAIFYDVLPRESEFYKQHHIGDPINSAIACIIARSTNRPVIIEKIEKDRKKTIKTTFKLVELLE